jgi:MoxR-like ATPase
MSLTQFAFSERIPSKSDEQFNEFKNELQDFSRFFNESKARIAQGIFGLDLQIHLALWSLIAGKHCLFEGHPGLAKTSLVKAIAQTSQLEFKRIQCTPDTMPYDVTGGIVYDSSGKSIVRKGPIFTDLLLVDEINRTCPKTQSAFLEPMEERQVSLATGDNDDGIIKLSKHFSLFATINPNDRGTYNLIDAILDRFALKISFPNPSLQVMQEILANANKPVEQSFNQQTELNLEKFDVQSLVSKRVLVPDEIIKKVAKLAVGLIPEDDTLDDILPDFEVEEAVSARASLDLIALAKVHAASNQRAFVDMNDIRFLLPHVLSHRLHYDCSEEDPGIEKVAGLIFDRIFNTEQ